MRLLLIDTCGETGSLALTEGAVMLRERKLPARAASALLVQAIREEMVALQGPLSSLDAVGVVNGPGSFTGVRVGLAAAKGLCEVLGLRLVTVSRLAVLLSIGGRADDIAVLAAGRDEFYARATDGKETLLNREALIERAGKHRILIAEDKLLTSLHSLDSHWVHLSAFAALSLVAEKLEAGLSDAVEAADANYVRNARTLYISAPTAQPQGEA